MRAAYWLEVSVACDGEAAEAVADFLQPFAHGGSVVIEQLGDPAGADPAALAAELTVKIFLPAEQDRPELRQRIAEGLYHLNRLHPIPAPVFQELEDEDWAEAWKRHFVPFRAGRRLWIQPSWQPAEAVAPAAVVLTLDPGMAFGTGTHPSTQLCLWALEELVWPSCTLLDVGTGSGILGIAAALLGAGRVLAMDTDWDAARAARANARLN
ncbi:MAG: 50S ribosomal protein L11 methyltransferase, partial [Candidatus Promineifilaceae bacterium]